MTDQPTTPDGDLQSAQPDKPQPPAEYAELVSSTCESTCLAPSQGTARLGFDITATSLESKASRLIRAPAPVSNKRDPPLPPALPLVPELVEDSPRYRHADESGVADPFLRGETVATLADDGDPVPGTGKRRSLLAYPGVGDNVVVDDHHDV